MRAQRSGASRTRRIGGVGPFDASGSPAPRSTTLIARITDEGGSTLWSTSRGRDCNRLRFRLAHGPPSGSAWNPAGLDTTASGKLGAAAPGLVTRQTGLMPATLAPGEKSSSASQPRDVNTPRRFVWAPVEGATGYRVQLYRGSSLVFSAGTTGTEVRIPVSWSLGGRRQSLNSGEYRWYVWPVVSGERASEAIVQARLVIHAR